MPTQKSGEMMMMSKFDHFHDDSKNELNYMYSTEAEGKAQNSSFSP